jgi:serine/threonine-protein kinase
MTAPPGRIGRYELVDRLGQGGMGTLYLARDPALGRTVAIKLLSVHSDELRERFAREARAAAALRHHNIVTIYDVGEQDGQPFIAMEYIEGETLAQVIRGGRPLLFTRKIELAQELCAGLGYAHRLGIVHRDIKPANIMVGTDGALKLLDFGLARLASDATQAGLTAIGVMVGTPHYMAPEQIEGRAIDRRTDIFAVGLVLYELLSYRKAYPGDSAYGVIHRILHDDPTPLETVCPGVDPTLAAIVRRAIEKDPSRRYQDLASLNADLGRVRQAMAAASSDATLMLGATLVAPGPEPRGDGSSGPPLTPRSDRRETLARRRAAEIQRHLETARARLESGDPQAAIEACEAAALIDPDDPHVLQVLEEANHRLASTRVHDLVQEARTQLDAGALSRAEHAIAEAEAILPDSAELEALRRDLRRARDHKRQQDEHERNARAVADEARRLFDDGAHDAAIAKLAAFAPPHDRVTSLHRELADAYAAIERERRSAEERREREAEGARRQQLLDQRLAAAEASRAAGDLDAALGIVQQLLQEYPAQPRATQLKEALQREVRARTERAALDARAAETIVTARRQFAAGHHAGAIRILSEFPAPHPAVSEALASLREELEAVEQARLEDARRREEEERRRSDDERRARDEARKERVEAALHAARGELAAGDLAGARTRVAEALVLAPQHEEAARLREEIEQAARERRARDQEEQRATQAVEDAHRLLAGNRGRDAVRHLEAFAPAHPIVTAALDAVRREVETLERERAEQAERARAAAAPRDGARPRKRPGLWGALGAGALLAAAGGWWATRPAPAPPSRPEVVASRRTPPPSSPEAPVAPAPSQADAQVREIRGALGEGQWTRAIDLLEALQRTDPSALAKTGLLDDAVRGAREYADERRRAAEQAGAAGAQYRDARAAEKQASGLEGLAAARAWIAAGDAFAAARPAAERPGDGQPASARLQRVMKSGNDAAALQAAAEVLRTAPGDAEARAAIATLQQRAQAAAAKSRNAAVSAGADADWPAFRTAADRERAAQAVAAGAQAVNAWWEVARLYDDAAGQAQQAANLVERAVARGRAGERAEAATVLEEALRAFPSSSRVRAAIIDLYASADRDVASASEAARRGGKAGTQAFRAAAADEQRARTLGRTPDAIRALTRAADGYKAALSAPAPSPAAPASPAPPAAPAADLATIRSEVAQVLAAVARAYESKDMDAINRLLEFMKYDSLKQIEQDFKEYRSIRWGLTLDRLDVLDDGSVRAACTVRRQIDKKSGRDISDVRPTVFTLRRDGTSWKIVGQSYPQ